MNVRDLPPPHTMHKCFWSERFEAICCRLRKETDDELTADFDLQLAAGRESLGTLSAEDRSRCCYHDTDWAAIADQSVRILEKLGCDQDLESYVSAASRSRRLGKNERWWLESLFADPIDVVCGSYNEGQHRGCALRFSGAERVAVLAPDELGEEDLG